MSQPRKKLLTLTAPPRRPPPVFTLFNCRWNRSHSHSLTRVAISVTIEADSEVRAVLIKLRNLFGPSSSAAIYMLFFETNRNSDGRMEEEEVEEDEGRGCRSELCARSRGTFQLHASAIVAAAVVVLIRLRESRRRNGGRETRHWNRSSLPRVPSSLPQHRDISDNSDAVSYG